MNTSINFEDLKSKLNSQTLELLREWLPGGRLIGKEYTCASIHGGKGNSFKYNIEKHTFCDFATGQSGLDLISLYALIHGLSQSDAAKRLGQGMPASPVRKITSKIKPRAETLMPVPIPDGKLPDYDGMPTHVYKYTDALGAPLFYIARYDGPDGKTFRPFTYYNSDINGFKAKAWPAPRPLYNLKELTDRPTDPVLIVEGETSVEAAMQFARRQYVIVTWSGGAQAHGSTDFTPLYGRSKVLLWPDADKPGIKAMNDIAAMLAPHLTEIKILNVNDMPDKWDAADSSFTWDTFKEWAKPRVSVYESTTIILDKLVANEPELIDEPPHPADAITPEIVGPHDDQLPQFNSSKTIKDSEISQVLADHLKTDWRYYYKYDDWYEFNGKIWEAIPQHVFTHRIYKLMDTVLPGGFSSKQLFSVSSLLSYKLSHDSDFQDFGNLVPMQNGVINLDTGELLPHDKKYNFNWILPYDYNPNINCPTFESFIDWIADGNEDIKNLLCCFLAACIRGMSDLQKYLEIVGTPGTGKSTYIKLAEQLVGEKYTVSLDFKHLGGKNETARIKDKRLGIFPDAHTWCDSASVFKSMTGGDKLRYEKKYRDATEGFVSKAMYMISTNQIMQFNDYSTAIARRRIAVFIDKQLPDEKKVDNYWQLLFAELPGIFNRLLMISEKEIRETLLDKKNLFHANRARALIETNPLANWIDDCLEFGPDFSCRVGTLKRKPSGDIEDKTTKLFPSFIDWSDKNNRTSNISLINFRKTLIEILQSQKRDVRVSRTDNRNEFFGIRVGLGVENS